MNDLLPVADAQAKILSLGTPLPIESTPLADAHGRWLAQDIAALRSQPAADLSAMDGYAIRHADLPGPWRLIGESAAGSGFAGSVGMGEAVRIFTGAPLPEGSDSVIVQEDVAREGDRVTLTGDVEAAPGRHVRAAGSDFVEGAVVLAKGTRITAARLALAALAGHAELQLSRRPRVAILATGSELVAPGATTDARQLPSSNSPMLAAMIADAGGEPVDLGIVADDLLALSRTFADAARCDIVVSTGGASVGDHDLVRPALEAAGGRIDFWKIRMRPGKPLICGTIGATPFLGLPGNPVSAFVTATLFLQPLCRHLAGCPAPLPVFGAAELGAHMAAVGGRDDYVRATAEGGRVFPLASQDSAGLLALSKADCLIRRPAHSPAIALGGIVDVLKLG